MMTGSQHHYIFISVYVLAIISFFTKQSFMSIKLNKFLTAVLPRGVNNIGAARHHLELIVLKASRAYYAFVFLVLREVVDYAALII